MMVTGAENSSSSTPAQLRPVAQLVSWLFHPLFIASYITFYLVYIHPYVFAGITSQGRIFILVSIFFNTAFIPGFAVLLMRLLRLTGSLQLNTQKDRIIPLAIAMIFYFWTWYVRLSLPDTPVVFKQLLMGAFLGVCITWMLNIFYKISMHAVGAGGLAMFFLLFAFTDDSATGLFLSAALLVAGLICSARLMLGAHTNQEVYSGFMAGLFAQALAWIWYVLL